MWRTKRESVLWGMRGRCDGWSAFEGTNLKGWEISGIKTILAICIKSKSHVDILNMSTRLFLWDVFLLLNTWLYLLKLSVLDVDLSLQQVHGLAQTSSLFAPPHSADCNPLFAWFIYGESKNAIKIQIWVTLIVNLLLMVVQSRLKRRWSFSWLATMVRLTLMYYVNLFSLLNNPEKDRLNLLEKASISPPEPS